MDTRATENNKREKLGFDFLTQKHPNVYVPTNVEKKYVLDLLGVNIRFKKAFDAVRLNVPKFSDIQSVKDFDLLEIKASDRKDLPNFPKGYFFSITGNEEMLSKVLNGKYFLCFVHPINETVVFMSWEEFNDFPQSSSNLRHVTFKR